MERISKEFLSANGINNVTYYIALPECNPRGIVQIVHGMCEYYERYSELESFLCARGYIVCGNDHIGHGRSVSNDEELGYFADKDGDSCVISDVGALHDIMRQKYRALPYIMIGHSFGSFVARAYVATHKEAVDALVLSGTAGQKQPVGLGKFLCRLIMLVSGGHYRSELVKGLSFSGYNKRFPDAKTGNEWVTSDKKMLELYTSDKLCSFTFTVKAYYDMFTIIQYIQSDTWYGSMPKWLPIFIIAGEDDPVGNYTKGVYELMDKLDDNYVTDIEFKVYSGERHELFTGVKREEAFTDVAAWIDEKVEELHEARRQGAIRT